MKVLIISTNRNRQPVVVMPFGAALVAQSVHSAGHEVRCVDLMFEKNPLRAVARSLEDFSPDVVGISIRNIDNNDMKNAKALACDALPVVELVTKTGMAEVILGGAGVSVMPEAFLRRTGVRWACVGDGAIVLAAFVAAIEARSDPRRIAGLAWIDNGVFLSTNSVQPAGGKSVPRVDFSKWFNMRPYLRRMAGVPVQTKTGCPYACIYCTYSISQSNTYALCEPEEVVRHIKKMIDSGLNDFEFVDNVFNAPYDHAVALCKSIVQKKVRARFYTVELNPGFLDDKLLRLMEQSGFAGIGVTAESASSTVLNNLGKDYDHHQLVTVAGHISRSKIPCLWIFLLGGPGETPETVQETLDFAENYIRPTDAVYFNVGLRIYPGTPLERIARTEGSLTIESDALFEPVFYMSPQVDKTWVYGALKKSVKKNMNFIDPDIFARPFLSPLSQLCYYAGMRPPLWKNTRFLRQALQLMGVH